MSNQLRAERLAGVTSRSIRQHEGEATMVFRMKNDVLIENVRQYPEEIVETLRGALAEGAVARPDPKRKGCYDIIAGSRTYYIYVSPRGKIVLVASWARPAASPEARRAELSFQVCCP